MTHLYRHYNAQGELLYIGISLQALERLRAHKYNSEWFDEIAQVKIERHPDRKAAAKAERDAIKIEKPKYNATSNERVQLDRAIQRCELKFQRIIQFPSTWWSDGDGPDDSWFENEVKGTLRDVIAFGVSAEFFPTRDGASDRLCEAIKRDWRQNNQGPVYSLEFDEIDRLL